MVQTLSKNLYFDVFFTKKNKTASHQSSRNRTNGSTGSLSKAPAAMRRSCSEAFTRRYGGSPLWQQRDKQRQDQKQHQIQRTIKGSAPTNSKDILSPSRHDIWLHISAIAPGPLLDLTLSALDQDL